MSEVEIKIKPELPRSHGGFHYNQIKPLIDGYKRHFSGVGPEASYAYVCLGINFEQTRFFFSDAASTAMTTELKEKLEKNFDEEFGKYLRSIHVFIRSVIENYMNVRQVSKKIFET